MRNKKKLNLLFSFFLTGIFIFNMNIISADAETIYYSDYNFVTKEEVLGEYSSEDYTTDATKGISKGFEGSIESYDREGNGMIDTTSNTSNKVGWFTKNGYKYYRMPNGELCTDKFIKIGRNYYSFDKNGRMRTGLISFSNSDKAYFSKTYGNFTNFVKVLKVVENKQSSILAKDIKGNLYTIALNKVVDKNQNDISGSMLKKNSTIHVIYRGGVYETYPLRFENAYKVRLMR